MFRALRVAPPTRSVESASREALYRSQADRLTMTSRFGSSKPTDNFPFPASAITQAPRAVPSSAAALTLATSAIIPNAAIVIVVALRPCVGEKELGTAAAMPAHSRPAVILSSTGSATGFVGSVQ